MRAQIELGVRVHRPTRTRLVRSTASAAGRPAKTPRMTVRAFKGVSPSVHPTAFVEDSAQIIGRVTIGERSSIWFNTVVRGDVHEIRIGARTNIQDLSMIHVLKDKYATTIGDDVTVGHHVVLHGC